MIAALLVLYFILLASCFGASLFFLRFYQVRLLAVLLFLSIVTEAGTMYLSQYTSNHYQLYHVFNVFEYTLSVLIVAHAITSRKLHLTIWVSIFFYTLLSLYGSFITVFNKYPSFNETVESILIITFCIIVFWKLPPNTTITLFQQPTFWFLIGFFLYFSGTIAVNSVYNHLLSYKSDAAKTLYTVFNLFFNYILYITILIGIRCFKRIENYLVLS